jgi:hypothetical protein
MSQYDPQKKLSEIRLYLNAHHRTFQNDDDIRVVLTYGLFYYADQLVHGKFKRPRRCVCKKWFITEKRNHWYHSNKCKDSYYLEHNKKRIKNNIDAAWLYRQRKQRGITPQPKIDLLSKIPGIRGSELDPNNENGAWVKYNIPKKGRPYITGAHLKPGYKLIKRDVRRIVGKNFDIVWEILEQAQRSE